MKNLFFFSTLLILLSHCDTKEIKRDRFFLQGNEALEKNELDASIKFFSNALSIDPNFKEALNNRGVAYVEDDHPYKAIQDYTAAIALDPNYFDAIFNRAYAYELINKFDNSLRDIDELLNTFEDSAYVHFYKGLILTKSRAYNKAISSFNRAIELDNQNPESYINLSTLYLFLDELDSAKYYSQQALNLDKNEANAFNTLSQVYISEGEVAKALEAIDEALSIVPLEPYFLNNRGYIFLQTDSLKKAETDINRSILLDPTNAWAYRNKGLLFAKQGAHIDAIRLFNEAIARDKFIDQVYTPLAMSQLALRQDVEACASLKKAVSLEEKNAALLLSQYCK